MTSLIELVRGYQSATTMEDKIRFAELVICEVRPAMWVYVAHRGHKEIADDVCQIVVSKISKNLHLFQGATNRQFWNWCYHVVRNELIDHIRHEQKSPVMKLDSEELRQAVDASVAAEPLSPGDRMDLEDIRRLLEAVKPPCVVYLWEYYIMQTDIAEIAAFFNLGYDAARKQIKRCLALAQSLVRN